MRKIEYHHPPEDTWTTYERIAFRFFFIYFIIQALPLDWKFYRDLISINWSQLYYGDIFSLARYAPRFFSEQQTFADWIVIASIAVVGAFVWSVLDRKRQEYDTLHYWLRVILRYRLAVAVIAFGFIKLFPLQDPYPSISNLNTYYGDYTTWKQFTLSIGIVPDYQTFLGIFEILAGLLLLNRRTTLIGAFIVVTFTGNVVLANIAYEGGEVVYSLYLVTIALFLLAYDVPRIFNLLTAERPTFPNRFRPSFPEKWQRNARLVLKGSFIFVFVLFYGYKTFDGYRDGITKYPGKAGLEGAKGIYNVTTFVVNGDTLRYSQTDPVRWKDVVFEQWNTISIRSNRPNAIDHANTEKVSLSDSERTYEFEGSKGRHYYSYETDGDRHVLHLQNRNASHGRDKLTLHFERPDSTRIILSGVTGELDSVRVVLDRIDKKYLLQEVGKQGRRRGLIL